MAGVPAAGLKGKGAGSLDAGRPSGSCKGVGGLSGAGLRRDMVSVGVWSGSPKHRSRSPMHRDSPAPGATVVERCRESEPLETEPPRVKEGLSRPRPSAELWEESDGDMPRLPALPKTTRCARELARETRIELVGVRPPRDEPRLLGEEIPRSA